MFGCILNLKSFDFSGKNLNSVIDNQLEGKGQ